MSALLNWFKLLDKLFLQSNMHPKVLPYSLAHHVIFNGVLALHCCHDLTFQNGLRWYISIANSCRWKSLRSVEGPLSHKLHVEVFLDQSTIDCVHTIYFKPKKKGIECTKGKKWFRFYCPNIYAVIKPNDLAIFCPEFVQLSLIQWFTTTINRTH